MTALRIPQKCLRPGRHSERHAYDPAIESAGMTLDTDRGPVDLVAVDRALSGQPVAPTLADVAPVVSLLPTGYGPQVEDAAMGLGISTEAVQRAVTRRRATEKKRDRTRP